MKSGEFGSSAPAPQLKKRNYKDLLLGFMGVVLVCSLIFVLTNKGKSNEGAKTSTIEYNQPGNSLTAAEEMELRKNFDESLARLDSLSAANASLTAELAEKNKEIANTKGEIRRILNTKNVTSAELNKAREMIASLNETISSLEQQITKLSQDNQALIQEKEELVQKNEKLTQDLTKSTELNTVLSEKVDIGSTLHASNIRITPVNVKRNDREKITHTAKRVDKLMISFDVSNRIADPGTKDIYVTVVDPDGQLITAEELGSGTFTSREEGDKNFTTKVPVEVEAAKSKQVEFSFKPNSSFRQGSYTIMIYQNGFKIGEGKSELKKGGLFG